MWTKLPPPILKALIINDIRHYWGDAISPGGDASPRRHCQVGARCPNLAIQYNDESGTRFVFACQGIEPCQANADAGTRRPQVRLRPPPDEIAPPQVRLCRPQVRLRPPQGSSLYDVIQHTFILNLCTCFLHLLYNVYICDLKSFFKINLRTLWNFTILFS